MDFQAVRKQLEPTSLVQFDASVFENFFRTSISYLKGEADTTEPGVSRSFAKLSEWFELAASALEFLITHLEVWNPTVSALDKFLKYLNHTSYHLINRTEVPLRWHKLLGGGMLELLSAYQQKSDHQISLLSELADKSYCFLCMVGKRAQKEADPSGALGQYYELYLLAAAFQSFLPCSTGLDGVKSAQNFLSMYSQLMSSAHSNSLSTPAACEAEARCIEGMFQSAVLAYTLRPRDVRSETTLCFVVELFKLIKDNQQLAYKLLASEGNLFRQQIDDHSTLSRHPGTRRITELNEKLAQATKGREKVSSTVLGILGLANELKSPCVSMSPKTPVNGQKQEPKIIKHLQGIEASVRAMCESGKPCSTSITCSLAVLMSSFPSHKSKGLDLQSLFLYHKLSSYSTVLFTRDVIALCGRADQGSPIAQRVYTLAVTNKTRIGFLQALVSRKDFGDQCLEETGSALQSVLKALCTLVVTVKKKNLLDITSSTYKQVVKCLESAVSSVGSVGRQLKKYEMYDVAVQLLSPLWPITNMEEMLPHVSHHEALAESYWQMECREKACRVIAEAAMISSDLITETLMRTLTSLAKHDASLPVLKIFEPCSEDDVKHAALLLKVVSWFMLSSGSPAITSHCINLLRNLVAHPGVSATQGAINRIFLAEHLWFTHTFNQSGEDGELSLSDTLEIAREAVAVLKANSGSSHEYDDYITQAACLYWDILKHTTCSKKANCDITEMSSGGSTAESLSPSLSPSQQTDTAMEKSERAGEQQDPMMGDDFNLPTTPLCHRAGVSQTPINEQMATPKRSFSSKRSGQPVPVKPGKMSMVFGSIGKLSTSDESLLEVDEELLMKKLGDCLLLWTDWFNEHGRDVTGKDGKIDNLRASRSLRFLKRVAELARLHHRPVLAVRALCKARNLAKMKGDVKVVREVTAALICLLSQLGLKFGPSQDGEEDIFMSAQDIGSDAHIMHLTSVAAYYMRTGQLSKFMTVDAFVSNSIEVIRGNRPLTPNLTTALAILKLLRAEYFSLSRLTGQSCDRAGKEEVTDDCPVHMIGESLKHICSVATFYGSWDYKNTLVKDLSRNIWEIVPEYLSILKGAGEIFLHIGSLKYARTLLKEGLALADKCSLSTWSAIFLSKLSEVSLNQQDTTSEARDYLQLAIGILKKHKFVRLSNHPTWDLKLKTETTGLDRIKDLSCPAHRGSTTESGVCERCAKKLDDRSCNGLLENPDATTVDLGIEAADIVEDEKGAEILCQSEFCCMCINAEIADVGARLMLLQAEILRREGEDNLSMLNSLWAACCTSQRLRQTPRDQMVKKSFLESGLQCTLDPLSVHPNVYLLLEALNCLAGFHIQNLRQPVHENSCGKRLSLPDIESLLDVVITEGKKLKGVDNSSMLVASAQLQRIHLYFLEELHKCSDMEEGQDKEKDAIVLAELVREAQEERAYWNTVRNERLGWTLSEPDQRCRKRKSGRSSKHKDSLSVSQPSANGCVSEANSTFTKKAVENRGRKPSIQQTPIRDILTDIHNVSNNAEEYSSVQNKTTDGTCCEVDKPLKGKRGLPKGRKKILDQPKSDDDKKEMDIDGSCVQDKDHSLSPLSQKLKELNLSPDTDSSTVCERSKRELQPQRRTKVVPKKKASCRKKGKSCSDEHSPELVFQRFKNSLECASYVSDISKSGEGVDEACDAGREEPGKQAVAIPGRKMTETFVPEPREEDGLDCSKSIGEDKNEEEQQKDSPIIKRARRRVPRKAADTSRAKDAPISRRQTRNTKVGTDSSEAQRDKDDAEIDGEDGNMFLEPLVPSTGERISAGDYSSDSSSNDVNSSEEENEDGSLTPELLMLDMKLSPTTPFRQARSNIDLDSVRDPYLIDFDLNTSIEIPRGRPQRKKAQAEKSEGTLQSGRVERRAKKKASEGNNVIESPSSECSRSNDKENIEDSDTTTSSVALSPVTCLPPARCHKSKLSLKKNNQQACYNTTPCESGSCSEQHCLQARGKGKEKQVPKDVYVVTSDSGGNAPLADDFEVGSQRKGDLEDNGTPAVDVRSKSRNPKRRGRKVMSISAAGQSKPMSTDEESCVEFITEELSSVTLGDGVVQNDRGWKDGKTAQAQQLKCDQSLEPGLKAKPPSHCKSNLCDDGLMMDTETSVSSGDCDSGGSPPLEFESEISQAHGGEEMVGDDAACEESSLARSFGTRFPVGASTLTGPLRLEQLQNAIDQIKHFPPSYLYGQLSRCAALCWWQESLAQASKPTGGSCLEAGEYQDIVAAHLTESMQVTFGHQFNRNLRSKISKCTLKPHNVEKNAAPKTSKKTKGQSELPTEDIEAMTEAVNILKFGRDPVKTLKDRLSAVPSDWTVVQITHVDYDLKNSGTGQIFLTRLTSDLRPVTVGIPYGRMNYLSLALRVFSLAIQHEVGTLSPQEYWDCRYHQDLDMQNLMYVLQEKFLGGHQWLMRGQLLHVSPKVTEALDVAARRAVTIVRQRHQFDVAYGAIRTMLEVLLMANTHEIASVLQCLWPRPVSETVTGIVLELQRDTLGALRDVGTNWQTRGPVLLILDKTLSRLPWESMPNLIADTVTRMPSLASLCALLTLHTRRANSPFQVGVDRKNVVAVIDPENDLQNTVAKLIPEFRNYNGWMCLIRQAPTVADLKSFLMDHSLYLYCGHGWGKQFVGGDDLQMFCAKAAAILMGCHSARLEWSAHMEGDGAPLYFLMAGCPTVVGNLWLVTDKDIDKLTASLMSGWMGQKSEVPLGKLMSKARRVCRLVGLNGYSPVVYGLPIMMNGS